MNWKKLLLGSVDYEKSGQDGHSKTSISVRGGWLPSLILLVGLAALIWWMVAG